MSSSPIVISERFQVTTTHYGAKLACDFPIDVTAIGLIGREVEVGGRRFIIRKVMGDTTRDIAKGQWVSLRLESIK